jgi:hypothetical protein
MDITDEHLNLALQEALTRYLTILDRSQKERESNLPCQGKGVETTLDVSTEEFFQIRIAAIEYCLQYTDRIANDVRKWMVEKILGEKDEPQTEVEEEISRGLGLLRLDPLPVLDEEPFLDIFSGKWIQPVTPFSAGPSGNREVEERSTGHPVQTSSSEALSHDPSVGQLPCPPRLSPATTTAPVPLKLLTSPISSSTKTTTPFTSTSSPQSSPPYQILTQMPRIFSSLVKPFSTVFTNHALPNSSLASSTVSTPSYKSTSLSTTLNSFFSEDAAMALRLQEQYKAENAELERHRQYALTLQDATALPLTGMSQHELDILEAQLLQDEFEEQEDRALAELSRTAIAALQEQWAADDAQLAEQESYVKELMKMEEERRVMIEADMVAAQQAQKNWEIKPRLKEEQAVRVTDKTARAEVLGKRENAERRQQARQAQCVACSEFGEKTNMTILTCELKFPISRAY